MDAAPRLSRPRVVVTGWPAHMGRHLADSVRADYQVFGIAAEPPERCGAPSHPNVTWFDVDVADPSRVGAAFDRIRDSGGADLVVFLAAPDGGEESDAEARRRVNVLGLQNVLEACRLLRPRRFVLATAASRGEGPEADAAGASRSELLRRYASDFPATRIAFEARPRVVVVGASGFIGRYVVDALKEDHHVLGLARTSQATCGVPVHPNVEWHQVDIGDRAAVAAEFRKIAAGGGADVVVHLAAYYDFTRDENPEYRRTNIDGLRNVLDACRPIRPKCFVFASSVAACAFPPPGDVLTESSPADGTHPYAVSKRIGEAILAEYREHFPSVVVRLGATYSDWCEYPPLFVSLERWRSAAWDRRILGGRGLFAIPYLHVRDAQSFVLRLLGRLPDLVPGEVLIASADAPVSMRDLFRTATTYLSGSGEDPLYLPRSVCRLGMYARELTGRALGNRPFERSWMAGFIDRVLAVDSARTRQRLAWSPRERLHVVRRLPFLVENLKNDPGQWQRRNHAVLRRLRTAAHLRVHRLLEQHEDRILGELAERLGPDPFSGFDGGPAEVQWGHRTALHQLMNAVRTRDMAVYLSFCRDLAARRFGQGFVATEAVSALDALGDAAVTVLRKDPESAELSRAIEDLVGMTTLFGRDQVEETFEELIAARVRKSL